MINVDWKSAVVLSLVGAGAVWFAGRSLKKYAPGIVDAVDPLNDENKINQGFEGAVKKVTGSDDPGGDLYNKTHNEDGSVKWWASPLWLLDRAGNLPDNGIGW